MIRNVTKEDLSAICRIYNYYIRHTIVTFEEQEIDVKEMERRVNQVTTKFPWIVYEENGSVIGYAYASSWKERSAYRFAVEGTVYLDNNHTGRGVGIKLYEHLLHALKENNIHYIVGGISLPNEASVGLHEKLGFKKCAHFSEVGRKFDQWIDVGYWEKIL